MEKAMLNCCVVWNAILITQFIKEKYYVQKIHFSDIFASAAVFDR